VSGNPWDDYKAPAAADAGPWQQYAAPAAPTASVLPSGLGSTVPDVNWQQHPPAAVPDETFIHKIKHVIETAGDVANDAIVAPAERGYAGMKATFQGKDPAAARAASDEKNMSHNPDAEDLLTQIGQAVPELHLFGAAGEAGRNALTSILGPEDGGAVASTVGDILGVVTPAVGLKMGADAALRPEPTAGDAALRQGHIDAQNAKAADAPDVRLRAAGVQMSPDTVRNMSGAATTPNPAARAAAGIAGPGQHADNIAANRPVMDGWAASDIGLPRGTTLTDEAIEGANTKPGAVYDKVKAALPDSAPLQDSTIQSMRNASSEYVAGETVPDEITNRPNILAEQPMNVDDLMTMIGKLRRKGFKNQLAPGADANSLGRAQLSQAQALEDELNSRVATQAPELNGEYQDARSTFAKIRTAEAARDGDSIDPHKVLKLADKNEGIDGGLKIIADAAKYAPNDVAARVPPGTGLGALPDVIGGIGTAGYLSALGHPAYGIAAGTTMGLVRPGLRKALSISRGAADADTLNTAAQPGGALYDRYFSRGNPPPPAAPGPLSLTPPPGPPPVAPYQPSLLRSGENVPPHEMGQLDQGRPPPPALQLSPHQGASFEPHQPDLPLGEAMAPDETVPFYHGGPNAVTKFDNGKIGTGEGNQSFSHGHYAGEAPAVGENYVPAQGGYLMKGTLPKATVDKMLDMDKPLKDQPAVLEALGVDPNAPVKPNGINPEWSGQELHDNLVKGRTNLGVALGGSVAEAKQGVSAFLASRGIPGAKYMDSVSRKAGAGTRNFVIYNPDDATILSQTKIEPKG